MRPATGRLPIVLSVLLTVFLCASACSAGPQVVFSTDFSSGIPAQFSAPGAVLDGVQGYAGLGPPGRQFGGNFLHYVSVPIFPTTLTLHNLPPHTHLSVKFLLAVIDSWDGTELMQISVDNSMKFNNWFLLATGDTTSYTPAPPGAILSMSTNLGFSGCCYYNRDRAYDLGVEPAFLNIPHTADSVVVTWTINAISGPAADQWQGGSDESWAIDAVSVEVSGDPAGVAAESPAGQLTVRPASNPTRGGSAKVQISIPESGRARVELLDIAGKMINRRTLENVSAGRHEVELSRGRRLAAGLYFARVTQGARSSTARLLVID